MNTLKGNQIKAAELIMEHCHANGYVLLAKILGQNIGWGLEIRDLEDASEFLSKDEVGFIKIDDTTKDGYLLLLTRKGELFKEKGKTIREIVEGEAEKEAEKVATESRDNEIKNLQLQDLVTKLNTINPNQLDFWKAQQRNNSWRMIISVGSLLISLLALMKSFDVF